MPVDNVPEFIKNNAQRGLDYLSEGFGGDGLTEGTKSAARAMADGNISDEKVRKMAPWFARHKAEWQNLSLRFSWLARALQSRSEQVGYDTAE